MSMRRRRLLAAAERRSAFLGRRLRALRGEPVQEEPLTFRSSSGLEIAAHVHRPAQARGRRPAVLLCPGIDDPGTVFDHWLAPIHADEVARLGAVVMHFDPAGRGQSWGHEDYGGPEHQDNVVRALQTLQARTDVDPTRVGVVAISLGVAMAVGAVAHHPELGVAWLVDWEGPCDREIITSGGRIMAPADGHAMDDDAYWVPREAVRHVGKLRCGYQRIQAQVDHAQPQEHRHAERMMQAVSKGQAAWFRLNRHGRNELPTRPVWSGNGTLQANRAILHHVAELLDTRGEQLA